MVKDCENETTQVRCIAERNGEEWIVSGGVALYLEKGQYIERPGYKFIRWITRCDDCFYRELDHKKQSIIRIAECV